MKIFLNAPKKIFFGISFLITLNLSAQKSSEEENKISVSAQMRMRAEFRDGTFQPLPANENAAALVSQRTRFSLNYQYKKLLSLQVSPQSITVWGQDALTQAATTKNSMAFFEAWVKLNLSASSDLQIGRQVISLDDERFFGELDWVQGARAHDAIAFHLQKEKFILKSYIAYNQNYRELYSNNLNNVSGTLFTSKDAAQYKWMQTVWGKYNFNKKNSVSILVSNIGFQNALNALDSAKNYFTQTLAVNFFHVSEQWKYNFSAYYQLGKNAQGKQTNAYLVAFAADKKINTNWNIGLGTDIVSGNDVGVTLSNNNKAFIPYFGTNHKFYGSMDYFYVGNGQKSSGLVDIYFKSGYKPNNKLALNFAAHQFISPNTMFDGTKNLSSNLGEELDVDFSYSIHKYAKLVGGYSIYSTTSALNFLKSVNPAHSIQNWLWLSINITPNIFNLKY
ncbi:MAG: alginate export family protein [Bacteroidetes bacterium]|nr:alginate export family protein [Bacteroidota bacterium]MBS1648214.1 alginate export family protein [Bacteroidota bacterium]